MKNVLAAIALVVLILFGLVGAILVGVILHEYSHAADFKDIAKEQEICGLVLPNSLGDSLTGDLGYYTFSLKDTSESKQQYEKVKEYTEYKAYALSTLVLVVFMICLFTFFKGWVIEQRKINELLNYQTRYPTSSLNVQSFHQSADVLKEVMPLSS
jgi:hypothetical protein